MTHCRKLRAFPLMPLRSDGVGAVQVDLDIKPGDGSDEDEKEAPMEQ